jgi:putative transposase
MLVSYSVRDQEPLVEALKMKALPDGSYDNLLEFLRLYRDAIQIVVNKIWSINEKLSKKKLHRLFYSDLVRLGFRAHHAKEIYVYAKSIVESARSGRRPILRRLSARIDKYDYKLDLETMTLTLKLHNSYEAKLKLLAPIERANKFRSWSNYEIVIKCDGNGFWILIYFKKIIKAIKPRTVMTIDPNFDNVTLAIFTLSGRLVMLKRFGIPLREVLTHKIWIERIQKRYSKSCRFIKSVRKAIDRHGKRIRSISWNYAYKLGDLVAKLASRHYSIIVLEDLERLENSNKKNREFNKKLGLWFYRRIQFCIEYEAKERNIKVIKINPRGTSSKCPICSDKLVKDRYRILRCRRCNFIGDRDVIATINLYEKYIFKYSRCGVYGVTLNAPKPNENPSGMQGNKNEAMKNYMNPCKS